MHLKFVSSLISKITLPITVALAHTTYVLILNTVASVVLWTILACPILLGLKVSFLSVFGAMSPVCSFYGTFLLWRGILKPICCFPARYLKETPPANL